MRVLFVDTETNGLPYNRYLPPSHTKNWPHPLQIAWQVWDLTYDVCYQRASLLVQMPTGVAWNAEAAAIHGITLADLQREGRPVEQVLAWLRADMREVDVVIAHNLSFDKAILQAAVHRLAATTGDATWLPTAWWPAHELCTMQATTDICKIPAGPKAKSPFKWPRLNELWTSLWPTRPPPQGLHDAATDVACLVACYRELLARRVLAAPAIPEREEDRFVALLREALRFWSTA